MGRNKDYRKLINTRKWQKLRLQALSKTNYLCAVCLKKDITTPATEVHHIVPVESGINNQHMKLLCYDPNNLLPVCKDCHKKEHIKLQSYTKNEVQKRNKTRTQSFTDKFLKQKKARPPLQ